MEDYGPRPMLALPPPIADGLERADVSIYAGQPKEGELAFRRALTEIINRRPLNRLLVDGHGLLEPCLAFVQATQLAQ